MSVPATITEYIATYPKEIQKLLKQVHATIKKAAPKATEVISYGMPAYKTDGRMLCWIAAHKNHIGLYPMASGIAAFKKEISKYKNTRGTVQFPFDKPLPLTLITRIVKFRVKENAEIVKKKKATAKVR